MSFTEKGNTEEVEALVNTLSIEGGTLSDANLSTLTTTDLQHLAELSQELHLSNEMDNQDTEVEMVETQEVELEEELVVQNEIGAQEVEVETEAERSQTPEEIVADVKPKTILPPLRPLTIAPKPEKVPIALKPVSGQQLLLVQGGAGQQIKLLSTHGQEINLTNLSLGGRSVTLKPAVKAISSPGNISVVQPKQVVMKKVIAPVQKSIVTKATKAAIANKPGHIMVVQKSEPQIKVVQSASAVTNTKTITLQQAQELGLLSAGKIVTQQANTKHAVVLNKGTTKTIKLLPPNKSPAKILPAPQTSVSNKIPQRIILKPTSTGQGTVLGSNQIIQVAGGQSLPSGVHQINIPGKGVQFIKFVSTTNVEANVTSVANTTSTKPIIQTQIQNAGTSMTLKPTNVVLTDIKPATSTNTIAPKPVKPTVTRSTVQLTNTGQLVVLPTYIAAQPQANSKVAIPVRTTPAKPQPTPEPVNPIPDTNLESNGMRPRKPCNCTKSQCLKLYCDCFANGEFCYMCNCMNCYNNLENEEHRQRAIKNCLERNPNAFRPKIGKAKDNAGDIAVRKHTKGCNCKRSGCLKNYCECYEAKIACSSNCKCMGCRNIEDSLDKKSLIPQATADPAALSPLPASKLTIASKDVQFRPRRSSNSKQAFSYITNDVIEATSQCLLALSDHAESDAQDEEVTKKEIIEEFGRCLMEIIDCSMTNAA